jgi:ATP-dependent DNA helicase RecG
MELSTPIKKIPRIGPAYQKKLKKMRIEKVKDILYHFPHRYDDFSNIAPISKVKIGENYCIKGKIKNIGTVRTWKRKMNITKAIVEDKTGAIKSVWFNQPYIDKNLEEGDVVCLAGKLILNNNETYFANPIYEKIKEQSTFTHTGRIVPVYPETEGISSRWLRYIIKPLLAKLRKEIKDPIPEDIRKKYNLLSIEKAIWQIHFPDSLKLAQKAKDRFSFEELFLIELLVMNERKKISDQKGIPISMNIDLVKKFVDSLPFKLTDAQKKCSWRILKDIERDRPMNRLLEGDVGSGKTVVAAIAALNTARNHYQVAFMAPTEILTKQHFKEMLKLLGDFKLNIGLLTGKTDKFISKKLKDFIEISRKKLLEKVLEGEIDILIGTHALIQDKVKFKNLALVILDEQHRFGVKQRAKLLSDKNGGKAIPHLLSMTATPIPRTLSLTLYGDLDLSLLDEMPKGRKKIITKIINPDEREETYSFIKNQIQKGKQVFVICPRIEPQTEEDKERLSKIRMTKKNRAFLSWSEVKAAKEEYEKLSQKIFPDLNIALLHGKMGSKEKEKIMKDFKNKKVDVLVSTSVVEVGVDVPNATVMVIEGAERFGLAQLHQFRGRVGRSDHQSFCFLFTSSSSRKTYKRLKALIECSDGFDLSEKDLEIRGPGNLLGTKQWGIPDLAMASLTNVFLIEKTREAAKKIVDEDPTLKKYPTLKRRVEEMRTKIHFE